MEIIKKSDMRHYLKKISKERNGYVYMINPDGDLSINGGSANYSYIIYQHGYWYGCKGSRIGASNHAPERGRILFGLSDERFCGMKDDGSAEYVTSTQALHEDTHIFMFVEHLNGMRLIIIDGKKSKVPYSMWGPRTIKTGNMMITIVSALVRQYDPQSADQIEAFWFSQKNENSEEQTAYNDNEEDDTDVVPW